MYSAIGFLICQLGHCLPAKSSLFIDYRFHARNRFISDKKTSEWPKRRRPCPCRLSLNCAETNRPCANHACWTSSTIINKQITETNGQETTSNMKQCAEICRFDKCYFAIETHDKWEMTRLSANLDHSVPEINLFHTVSRSVIRYYIDCRDFHQIAEIRMI